MVGRAVAAAAKLLEQPTPSIRGIIRSVRITFTGIAVRLASASRPSPAVVTWNPRADTMSAREIGSFPDVVVYH